MTKKEFFTRAKAIAARTMAETRLEVFAQSVDLRRKLHLDKVREHDQSAAELEKAVFDAENAFHAAEMQLAKYYAARIEKANEK